MALACIGAVVLGGCSDDAPQRNGSASGDAPPTAATDANAEESSAPTASAPSTTETPPALSESDAASLLATFDPSTPGAADLVTFQGDPAVVAAAASALAAGATGWERWAAVYVWVNEGDSVEPLMGLLADEDAAVRLMAAAGVLGRGGIEGFEPLIAALDDTSVLGGAEPPVMGWTFATSMLVSLTGEASNGPPFDADESQRAAAKTKWTDWLSAHRATLRFDAVSGRWTW